MIATPFHCKSYEVQCEVMPIYFVWICICVYHYPSNYIVISICIAFAGKLSLINYI